MKYLLGLVVVIFMGSAHASLLQVDLSGAVAYPQQYHSGTHSSNTEGSVLTMDGNNWVAISGLFEITSNTIFEFDFSSSNVGEIHGIAFENDLNFNFAEQSARTFQIAGSQGGFGIQDFNTYSGSGTESFSIDIGNYFTGTYNYMIFINDDDSSSQNANSVYGTEQTSTANVSAPSTLALLLIASMVLVGRKFK